MTKKKVIFFIGITVILFVVVIIYKKYIPTEQDIFPKCPVKLLTGLSCPGCGIQRAFHSLLCGNIGEALTYNYSFILSIPYAVLLLIAYFCKKLGKGLVFVRYAEHRYGIYSYILLFFLWFVIRNIFDI